VANLPDVHPNAPAGGSGTGFSKSSKPLGLNAQLDVADFTRGPVGRDPFKTVGQNVFGTSSSLQSQQTRPTPPPTAIELTLVGHFPRPATWTDTVEKNLIAADTWFPHTLDFIAVGGRGSVEITTEWDFLLKIMQARAQIKRLNFFSHATTSLIAMAGDVLPNGTNVNLTPPGWTQVISGHTGPIMDPYARTWGTFGENSATVTVVVGNVTFNLDNVRAKFAEDAVIWLYLCHGASDPNLFQEIANTFQVTVKGFSKEVVYCAPAGFPSDRKHKVAVVTTSKPSDSCPNGVADFHGLDSNANARSASPRKP
jgi:hypothetical protein